MGVPAWQITTVEYLIRPINFDETERFMEYRVAQCMGDRENFPTRNIYLNVRSLYKNNTVCICLEEISKDGKINNILPLYPLLATFSNPRGDQVYMYLEFDSTQNEYTFIHPFGETIVGSNDHPVIYNELERRIRYGLLSNNKLG
jgi:hypothetical protein